MIIVSTGNGKTLLLLVVDYLSKLEIWIVVLLFVLVFEAAKIQEKEHPKSGCGRSGGHGAETRWSLARVLPCCR